MGESHFEKAEIEFTPNLYAPPAPPFDVSEPVEAAGYVMVRFPAGWDSEFHCAPRRQLFIVLSGEFEGTASDGATVKGEDDVYGLMVQLE